MRAGVAGVCVAILGLGIPSGCGSAGKPGGGGAPGGAAGAALEPSFQGYRVVGVQTELTDPAASKGVLGNPFVEFNANVAVGQASCITCHNAALYDVDKAPRGVNPNGQPLPG